MRWCPTTGGAPRRRELSASSSAATLCMLALATHLTMAAANPLRPSSNAEFSARYEDFDAGDEEPYSFQYEVDAPYHGTWHDRREVKSGQDTEGRFRVALPDHRLQTVTYRATHARGFTADVQFEQHPDFDALRGGIGKAPVIGTPVVPSAPHPQSGGKAPIQGPAFGYQIEVGTNYRKRQRQPPKASAQNKQNPSSHLSSKVGTDYGKRQRQPPKAPAQNKENPSSHLSSTDYGKRQRQPPKAPGQNKENPSSHSSSKFSSRPLSISKGSHSSQPLSSSEKSHIPRPTSISKSFHSSRPLSSSEGSHTSQPLSSFGTSHFSRPLSSSEGSHTSQPLSSLGSSHFSRPLSSSEEPHFSRPSASRPLSKPTSRPSVVYELSEDSSLSQHSPGSLSAFVSISPHLIQHTTPLPIHVPRRPTPASSSAGYLPSPPTGHKKVVASRPLRTRQRTTARPLRKPQDARSSYKDIPLSFGDKQISRPIPSVTSSAPEEPYSDPHQEDPFPQGETVAHLPDKADPNENGNESPGTTDESFSIGSPERYSIRKESMSSIRFRLNSIVHDK